MLKTKIAGIAVSLAVAAVVPQTLSAQYYGPYTDPARMTFASQGCTDTWQDQGYESFRDCYDAYYKSYPNKPIADPE